MGSAGEMGTGPARGWAERGREGERENIMQQ